MSAGKAAMVFSGIVESMGTVGSLERRDDLVLWDGDPLDAVEFSETAFPTGAVVPVRSLGAFALIDEVRRKERDIDFFCQPSF